ncbi:MAG: hypothetical protein FWC85_00300 [Elusimicrobia bacterium]|nr:hypothetical protein [Elusimicrobiota bacterium]
MNNKMKKLCALLFVAMFFVLGACDRFPLGRLLSPSTYGTPEWGDVWPIYTDAIRTRGRLDATRFTNWADGAGSGRFAIGGGPRFGNLPSILFDWTGGPSNVYLHDGSLQQPAQTDWVGWGFEAPPPPGGGTPGYDYRPGGYTRLSFYVRGVLRAGVELIVETGNTALPQGLRPFRTLDSTEVTNSWQEFHIDLTAWDPNVMTNVEYVVVFTLRNTLSAVQSNGGTIYLANIRLIR